MLLTQFLKPYMASFLQGTHNRVIILLKQGRPLSWRMLDVLYGDESNQTQPSIRLSTSLPKTVENKDVRNMIKNKPRKQISAGFPFRRRCDSRNYFIVLVNIVSVVIYTMLIYFSWTPKPEIVEWVGLGFRRVAWIFASRLAREGKTTHITSTAPDPCK